jgi:hypothetical protein
MKKYRDYLDIIKQLQEFTKLKLIIFSKSQRKLFSLATKPKVTIDSKNILDNYLHGQIFEDVMSSTDEVYKAYNKLNKKKDSIIDTRLVSLMDKDLKNYLELYYQ